MKPFSKEGVLMLVHVKTKTNSIVPMKNPIKFAIAALALGLAIPAARAQDTGTPPPPPPAGEHEGHHKGPRGDLLKFYTEKLSLTVDQQAKVKPIVDDQKKALEALHNDATVDKDAKWTKSQEIVKAHHDQIRPLLTPEQQTKFDALKDGPGGPRKPKE
jgi:Spy/CpxP family protein refolding chaperone